MFLQFYLASQVGLNGKFFFFHCFQNNYKSFDFKSKINARKIDVWRDLLTADYLMVCDVDPYVGSAACLTQSGVDWNGTGKNGALGKKQSA